MALYSKRICCFYFLDSLRFSADKSHLHNEFFLAILNKCQALASFQPSPSTRIPPVALGSPSPPATTSLGQPRFSQLGSAQSLGGDDRLKVGSLKVLGKIVYTKLRRDRRKNNRLCFSVCFNRSETVLKKPSTEKGHLLTISSSLWTSPVSITAAWTSKRD